MPQLSVERLPVTCNAESMAGKNATYFAVVAICRRRSGPASASQPPLPHRHLRIAEARRDAEVARVAAIPDGGARQHLPRLPVRSRRIELRRGAAHHILDPIGPDLEGVADRNHGARLIDAHAHAVA